MEIQRTDKEIIIRVPNSINSDDLQDFINYIRYKECTSDVNVPQTEIDKLASEVNKKWWRKNREKFIK